MSPHPAPPLLHPPAVYNANDYCDIMEHLIERWDIEHRQGLRGDAAEAQVWAACSGCVAPVCSSAGPACR